MQDLNRLGEIEMEVEYELKKLFMIVMNMEVMLSYLMMKVEMCHQEDHRKWLNLILQQLCLHLN